MLQPGPFVNAQEARVLLGYKRVSSVLRLVYSGRLVPAHKGSSYVFHRADVERIRAERIAKAAEAVA